MQCAKLDTINSSKTRASEIPARSGGSDGWDWTTSSSVGTTCWNVEMKQHFLRYKTAVSPQISPVASVSARLGMNGV
jgi:hypothetical protein